MATALSAAQVTALAELYENEVQLGREHPDLLDQALDLALSERRQDQSGRYLHRNVLRNARFSVQRRAQTRISTATCHPFVDPSHLRRVWRDSEGRQQVDIIDNRTPESAALASDLLTHLRGMVEQLGEHGLRCLDGLLAGLSARETAKAAGISTATVERCWRSIRRYVRENFYPDYRR
jgi:hypothetical protein